MHMPIATGTPFRFRILLQHRDDSLEKGNHRADALGLGVHFQQCLLKIGIERKRSRQPIGKLSCCAIGFLRLCSCEPHDFAMQLDCSFLFACKRLIGFIAHVKNLRLKKRALFTEPEHLKPALTFSKNIHAAVVILLKNVDDLGGAADVYETFFFGANHTKLTFPVQTFIDHLFVTRLKDMKWQGHAGKQHHVERK